MRQDSTGTISDIQNVTRAGVSEYTKESVEAAFLRELEQIPFADSDGLSIIGDILGANTLADLQTELQSKLPKAEEVAGRQLKVNDLVRQMSTIDASENESAIQLPWYIMVDSTDTATGERVLWQTSAGSVTAKLARLYNLELLPAVVEVRKAEKATRKGFWPMNLIVHAASGT